MQQPAHYAQPPMGQYGKPGQSAMPSINGYHNLQTGQQPPISQGYNPPPSSLPNQPNPHQYSSMPNQMQQLNLNNPSKMPPPISSGYQTNSYSHPVPSAPHSGVNQRQPNMQPQSNMQMPPHSMAPPNSAGIQPNSMGMPPSTAGMPPNSMGMPPNSMGMPPSSTGIPPNSMGMPPNSRAGINSMGMPPNPMGGAGLPSAMGMPPNSMNMPPRMQGSLPPSGQTNGMNQMPNMGMQRQPGPQPGMLPSQPGMPPNQPGMPPTHAGMPPSTGMAQQPGMPPGGGYPGAMPQQAQRQRLNPDAMPSPIQVITEDRLNRQNETFNTEGRGKVPPLVTTKFTVNDGGSASPRYVRCATYNLPSTADIAKTCQVPMALSIKALATLPENEAPPLVVDPGPDGPLRCKRCKAYMCPQFKFIEGGRRYQCIICNAITDTPHHYFDHVDHMGQRVDRFQRPELCRGSYEFVTTKDYCKNDKFPNVPAYIFAIDVSYNAVKCGMVDLLCSQIKHLINNLPCDVGCAQSVIRVGFVTYNNTIHFYNLKSTLAQPQVMVVSDVADVFVPLQDGFLVDVNESRHVIESLLDQIPQMYADTRETSVVFGPVIQAAVEALESAECSGKLLLFHSTLPSAEAPGKLKNRDDRKLIGTDKEKVLFNPASNFYEKLSKDCVAKGCCVDLFLFPNQYIDVATLGQVALLTGGDIYRYNFFRPDVDGERFVTDLKHNLSRDMVFDAILRVRTSTGIRPVDFIGSMYMSNTTDVELAGLDCDKAITVELKHDDKLSEDDGGFVQVALLYTSVGGKRRLRIHNVNLSVCTQLPDLYRSCENDVLINYMAKLAVRNALTQPSVKIRDELISRSAAMLACYRKHCASPSSPGQLILPECMKLLPVYLNCILNNDGIHSSQDIATDERAYLRQLIYSMDVASTQQYFYPRLTPVLDPPESNETLLPAAQRCSEDRLTESNVYILHNGVSMFLWIGAGVPADWVRAVFGVQSPAQIDIDSATLPVFDNQESNHLRQLVAELQKDALRQMKLTIVRQRDKLESWFKHYLVEDRGRAGGASYIDFLCHVHKEVRALLS